MEPLEYYALVTSHRQHIFVNQQELILLALFFSSVATHGHMSLGVLFIYKKLVVGASPIAFLKKKQLHGWFNPRNTNLQVAEVNAWWKLCQLLVIGYKAN